MGQVPRRQFLIATGALLASRLANAQTPAPDRRRTVGVLILQSDSKRPEGYLTSNVMRKLGWIEGKNLVIEHRFADSKTERLAGLVEELLRKRVEVLHTVGSPATLAARERQAQSPSFSLASHSRSSRGWSIPLPSQVAISLAQRSKVVLGSPKSTWSSCAKLHQRRSGFTASLHRPTRKPSPVGSTTLRSR